MSTRKFIKKLTASLLFIAVGWTKCYLEPER